MKSIIDYTNKLKDFFAQKQALSDEVETRAVLGAHNLFNIKESQINVSGTLTATVDNDESITLNGTGTAAFALPNLSSGNYNGKVYKLKPSTTYVITYGIAQTNSLKLQAFSKASADGSWSKFAEATTSNSLEFTTPSSFYDIWIRILLDANTAVSSLKIYPLIKLATDADTTHGEFTKTNVELTKDDSGLTANAFANGAVNLAKVIWTSQVYQGLTTLVNDDKTISVSGSNSQAWNAVMNVAEASLKAGRYRIRRAPSGAKDDATYWLVLRNKTTSANIVSKVETEDVVFTLSSDTDVVIILNIDGGYSITGTVKFEPMITVADMPNSDYAHYVPYRMSNGELTDNCVSVNGNIKMAQSKSITIECFAVPCKPDANTVYVPILFPFILTNDSYSVSLVEVGAAGIGGIALTDCTVDRKKTGGFSFTISGNTNANNAPMISVKYTLTY